jgi:formylglycine-generating enzyme required for sulfatase activity
MKKIVQQLSLIVALISISTMVAQDYIAPSMVNIPEGNFMMGSLRGNKASQPVHAVSIAAFQMAKFPVTVAEFSMFVKETNYKSTTIKCPDFIDQNWYSDPGEKSNGNWKKHNLSYSDYQPVTCITYQDVNAYIKWLNKKSGFTYRLPTEEEWEYAARATTTSTYFWGNDITESNKYANFADQSSEYFVSKEFGASYVGFIGMTNENDGEPYGAIVGLYRPNPFGLYDMVGNVSQMLSTSYREDYRTKSVQYSNSNSSEFVAERGGSWHYKPRPIWYRGRTKVVSDYSSTRRGFRLAIDGHKNEVDSSTMLFDKNLKKAQHIRLVTRPKIPNAPKDVMLVQLKDSLYKISWNLNNDPSVIGYEIYQSNDANAHLLGKFYQNYYNKIKTVPLNKNSTEIHVKEKGNSFRVVAKTATETSLPSVAVVVKKKTAVVSIPGTIAMEKNSALENATLSHRKARADRPELYYLTVFGEAYVRNVASIKFHVKVEKTGWYQINYTGGPRSGKTGTFFMMYQNNTLVGEVNYNSKTDNKTTDLHKVYLEKGNHNLKLSFLLALEGMDIWNLGSLKFTSVK